MPHRERRMKKEREQKQKGDVKTQIYQIKVETDHMSRYSLVD